MPARRKRPTSLSQTTTRASSSAAAASPSRCGSSRASRYTRSRTSSMSCTGTTTASTGTRSKRSWRKHVSAQLLLEVADDELILGWRNSEWTGIAPMLEEDVAFSSIAQNEIGHARALYELAARELGTTADELAFDRAADEDLCAPLVELRRLDWAHAIAGRWVDETADEVQLGALPEADDEGVAGRAPKG